MYTEKNEYVQKIMTVLTWIMRLAQVNLLWIFFTLFGLILFGLGPATYAMTYVLNKLNSDEDEFSMFKVFKNKFIESFFKSNQTFFLLSIIGGIVTFNIFYATRFNMPTIINIIIIWSLIFYILIIVIIFPVSLFYENTMLTSFKNTVLFIIGYPINSIIILISIISLILIQFYIPGLIVFFSASTIMYITVIRMNIVIKSFEMKKVNKKTISLKKS